MSILTFNKASTQVIHLQPVVDAHNIEIVFDVENMTATHNYAYSFDDENWSDYFVDPNDLTSTLAIAQESTPFAKVFIKIQIALQDTQNNDSGKHVVPLMKGYQLLSVKLDAIDVCVVAVEVEANPILRTDNTMETYNPYRNTENALELNRKLSKIVSNVVGLKCTYHLTEPVDDSKNVTLKTYGKHAVVEEKEMKVVIKGNQLPSNRIEVSQWEASFSEGMTIHIDMTEWANTFGDKKPSSKDIIHLHLNNKIYQVNTIFADSKFMEHAIYYTAILKNYKDVASVSNFDPDHSLVDFVEDFSSEFEQYEQIDATLPQLENPVGEGEVIALIEDLESEYFDKMVSLNNGDNSINRETTIVRSYQTNIENHYSIMFWLNITNKRTTQNILTLSGEGEDRLKLILNKNGGFTVDATTIDQQTVLNPSLNVGNDDIDDQLVAVVVNYIHDGATKFITLSVFDENFDVLQEGATSTFKQHKSIDSINWYGAAHSYANLKVAKTITKKSEMINKIKDKTPQESQYFIVDYQTEILT